jgi:hypothetical protein
VPLDRRHFAAANRAPAKPSVNEQEPEMSASRRSNEFWLAMAGIFATALVGMTASALAYRTSGNQIKAETEPRRCSIYQGAAKVRVRRFPYHVYRFVRS